jgi:hypothetical protein
MKRPPSALLLRLYPTAYRRDFEDEMLDVLCAASREAQLGGVWLNTVVTLRESRGLIAGALREHARQRFGEYSWFKVTTRRSKMRSEFRYPRAAFL